MPNPFFRSVMTGFCLLGLLNVATAMAGDRQPSPNQSSSNQAPADAASRNAGSQKPGSRKEEPNSSAPIPSAPAPSAPVPNNPVPADAKLSGSKKPASKSPNSKNNTRREERRQPPQGGTDGKAVEPKRAGAKQPGARSGLTAKDKERETAALTFSREHHPELAGLIEQLKDSNPAEYQRAIRDLARTSERLAQVQQKDAPRYEVELKAWKISSRIRLVVARLTMGPDSALEQELRDALAQQAEVRLSLLQMEQEQVRTRLKKLDAQIEAIRNDRDNAVQNQFDTVLRAITKARSEPPKGPPAPQKKVTQSPVPDQDQPASDKAAPGTDGPGTSGTSIIPADKAAATAGTTRKSSRPQPVLSGTFKASRDSSVSVKSSAVDAQTTRGDN